MTPGRLAVLVVAKLAQEGYLSGVLNIPTKIAEGVIKERMRYGDVVLVPDDEEKYEAQQTGL